MPKIKVLGGAQKVGKNALLVEDNNFRVLLDYGVDISGKEPEFPLHVRPRDIAAAIITHAHLDHSGAAPLLYVSSQPKLITTQLTLTLTDLLINDFLKLSKYYVPYDTSDLEKMRESALLLEPGDVLEGGEMYIHLWNAGHIPGSVMVDLETKTFRLLYTGDFNIVDTHLLSGADLEAFKNADIVVMEATYAGFDHPPREAVEREFVERVIEVLDSGGKVLIPAFAVARSQEILCMLVKHGIKYPIYVDGMARRVNTILLENAQSLRDPELYRKACKSARHVTGPKDRKKALQEPSVVISPAAMLKGGASVHYMKHVLEDPASGVFFVSYLMRETPARRILETGVFNHETVNKKVKARLEWFDFSSHCGRSELRKVIETLDSRAKLIIVHSDSQVGLRFAEWVRKNFELDVVYPQEGEVLDFR